MKTTTSGSLVQWTAVGDKMGEWGAEYLRCSVSSRRGTLVRLDTKRGLR
jgi:hypothetical protein